MSTFTTTQTGNFLTNTEGLGIQEVVVVFTEDKTGATLFRVTKPMGGI